MSIIEEKRNEELERIIEQHGRSVREFLDKTVVPYFVNNISEYKKKFNLPDTSKEFSLALHRIALEEYGLHLYEPFFGRKKKIIISISMISDGM